VSERKYMKQKVKPMKTERRVDETGINKNGCLKDRRKRHFNN
jgi:hypothetical protein